MEMKPVDPWRACERKGRRGRVLWIVMGDRLTCFIHGSSDREEFRKRLSLSLLVHEGAQSRHLRPRNTRRDAVAPAAELPLRNSCMMMTALLRWTGLLPVPEETPFPKRVGQPRRGCSNIGNPRSARRGSNLAVVLNYPRGFYPRSPPQDAREGSVE
ncbi:uncharacterized protein BO72DRAFT_54196 [Aspergillus fijiensis CBS 313.89]|uniref:Uncharacterized protein n=1 Tax=Aspergillus fijiensis CBS 313.89 TaxID=1448319 RepID=A0A8G1RX81_9EURO|nr:uncharacterized protein BO72DRAFT_54196 [Aspergillus fijiensis CBS 313.89]RAK79196.1 hypothetical protein BO72DRAFT_54196 [Aspergillus fijiensis CBS 313.89]